MKVLYGIGLALCTSIVWTTRPASAAPPPNVVASDAFGSTAMGSNALQSLTSGVLNTASGNGTLTGNTTGSANTASGADALNNNTQGSNNTAVGYHALYTNFWGEENTAIGAFALNSNTMGSDNTAIGYSALNSNTTGIENTALGLHALASNTTGFHNTATGVWSLISNSTGTNNTAVGHSALYRNTTGGSNTAGGYAALFSNETGSKNTAFGFFALELSTSASENTAFGYQAMLSNTTGSLNTAQGNGALSANTTGIRNTAMGYNALSRNKTGKSNLAIGYRAGDRSTGNDNVLLANHGEPQESQTMRLGANGTPGVISSGVTRTFIAGISGVQTGLAGSAVIVDANGQLGTISSSRRFKHNIQPMADASDRIERLRPVTFQYIEPDSTGERKTQYGLIAEEVAEVFPELVVYDATGQPQSVAYHVLPALLLNELQKEHRLNQQQAEQIALQESQLAEVRTLRQELLDMKEMLAALQPQSVNPQVAMR